MGASIGTFINSIAPTWLLCILLVIVLTATGIRTLQKAITAGRQEWWFPHSSNSSERTTLVGVTSSFSGSSGTTGYANGAGARSTSWKPPASRTTAAGTTSQTQEPKVEIPWRKLGMLFALFAGFVGLSLLQLVVPQTSFLFFIVAFLPTILLIVFSQYAMKNVLETFRKQQNPYYLLTSGEIQWTPHSIRYFPLLSIAAGMISGMFGIGGGIINAPLMLEIGIDPSAASAMTATTVLFSSASTCTYFVWCTYCSYFELLDQFRSLTVLH